MTTNPSHLPRRAGSADDAVSIVTSGMRVFVHGAAATPTPLLEALVRSDRPRRRRRSTTCTRPGPAPFADAPNTRTGSARSRCSPARRCARPSRDGRADFIPIFLSDIPSLFLSGRIAARRRAAAALAAGCARLLHARAPRSTRRWPPSHSARFVVAEINERMPRTHGNTLVPLSRVDAFVHTDRPLHEHAPPPPTDGRGRDRRATSPRWSTTARRCRWASARFPTRRCARLGDKHDLGVHTEMFSDGIVDLVEARRDHEPAQARASGPHRDQLRRRHASGSTTSSTTTRSSSSIPAIAPTTRRSSGRTTRSWRSTRRSRSTCPARSCADSIGFRIYSGIGGQMDFIRGAALSAGGKPIIALPSTAGGGRVSRIVSAAQARRRRRDDARSRALGRDRVRRGQPVRTHAATARRGPHRHRAPRRARRASP